MEHSASAYAFANGRMKEIANGWPETVKHALHEAHQLVLSPRNSYLCDGCSEHGVEWSFYCSICDFDLHPKCALFGAKLEKNSADIAKGWPEKVKHALHEVHELVFSRRKIYICDGCSEPGVGWSFYCNKCDFDLHPQCAIDGAKDDKNSEDIPAKEIAKGWPEKAKHALHKQHELVLSCRKNYICDGCTEHGAGWSFYCNKCDFDLHPQCALDGQKVEKNFEDIPGKEITKGWPEKVKHALHEHELVLSRRNNYFCDGCKYPGVGWSFCCNQCNFDLHPNCALDGAKDDKNSEDIPADDIAKGWPEKAKHALHEEHELVFTRRKNYICDGCSEPGVGWSFRCNECNFDLHPKCAIDGAKDGKNSVDIPAKEIAKGWPEKAKHALHKPHELVLSCRKNYICDGCTEHGAGWSFYCNKCDFDLHPQCALDGEKVEKNSEDIPGKEITKGWPEKVKHALHEHELVLGRRNNYFCDGCKYPGVGWSFCCDQCNFDLHPKCALDGAKDDKNYEDILAHEISKEWPAKVNHALHKEHQLVLSHRKNYVCDGCNYPGNDRSFCCNQCNFDLHPKCALDGVKDEKNSKDIPAEDIAKGWPEKVKHALHEQHELVLSHRKNYVCDGCKYPGNGWSYCCNECNFDLHLKCALYGVKDVKNSEDIPAEDIVKRWPEKAKHALHEQHELVLSRRKNYFCDGCKYPGVAWSFCCNECNFDLHPKCALGVRDDKNSEDIPAHEMSKGWPKKVKHALHEEHELVFSRQKNYICDGCSEPGVGWSFCCNECNFDLHPKCALDGVKYDKNSEDIPAHEMSKGWPEKLKHALHAEHELVFSRRKNYICDGCSEPGVGWSFCCNKCNFDLHPKCSINMEAGDNDFKIAFELQLQDAIIVQEQKELMRKFDQEQKDAEEWGRDMGRVRNQIQVHTYDYRFAQELSRIPEDEWVKNGDNVHKPFDEVATSSSSVDDSEPFRLYFKGCYSNKSDGEGIVCAIGAAVCDSRDNLILNVQKPLIGDFNQEELEFKVEAEALMEGLKAALSLGIKKISFFCDFHPLFQYITTRWLIKEQNIEELVYQVCLLQKKFDSCFPFFVARKNVKFAFKLARDAIDTQITRSAESTHAKILKETCSICLEDTDISQMFVVDHCLHRYCLSCMKQHVQVKLLDEMMLRCPYEDCKTELDIGICRKFLPTELIDLMEQRLKESSIAVTYRVYCPDPRCSKLMSKPDMISNTDPADLPAVTCIKCQGLFCINCEVPWHSDIRCDEYKRLNPNPSSEDAKLKFLATTRSWTQCTKCKNMIELAEGCYHITCRCRYEFCYTCGFEWCDKKPTCTCPIWDERNILNDPELV